MEDDILKVQLVGTMPSDPNELRNHVVKTVVGGIALVIVTQVTEEIVKRIFEVRRHKRELKKMLEEEKQK